MTFNPFYCNLQYEAYLELCLNPHMHAHMHKHTNKSNMFHVIIITSICLITFNIFYIVDYLLNAGDF